MLVPLFQLLSFKLYTGISVKSQELYLLVFLTRYLDLFTTFYSMYNSVWKVLYIFSTTLIILQIKYLDPIKSIYNFDQDSFPHWKFAVAPCFVMALIVHVMGSGFDYFSLMEWFWTFSIILESIAIIPQLQVLRKYRLVENLPGKFMLSLGLYRFFYILNWIHRSRVEFNYRHHYLVYICGVIQTLMYADFMYQYVRARFFHKEKVGGGEAGSSRGVFIDDDENDNGDDDTQLIFELSSPSSTTRQRSLLVDPDRITEPLLESSDEHENAVDPLGHSGEDVEGHS